MNLKELQAMTAQRGIVGRSKMNKAQLEAAIAKHDAPATLPDDVTIVTAPDAKAVLATMPDELIADILGSLGKPEARRFRKRLASLGLRRQAALVAA